VKAFQDDPGHKANLLATLDRGDELPLIGAQESPDAIIAWATGAGFEPAFVLLVEQLARGGDEGRTFVREMLEAIPVGADLRQVPHRWVLWAWHGAAENLRSFMNESGFRDAGTDAAVLHARVANGAVVDKREWREVRSRLNLLASGNDDAALAASVLAASCWDYATVPGAAADMASAWEQMVMARVSRDENWGDADRTRVQQLIIGARSTAEDRVGPLGHSAAREEGAAGAHKQQIVDTMLTLLNESGDPDLIRNRDVNEKMGEARSLLRTRVRKSLINFANGGPLEPALN
jgi:hypothetical protein